MNCVYIEYGGGENTFRTKAKRLSERGSAGVEAGIYAGSDMFFTTKTGVKRAFTRLRRSMIEDRWEDINRMHAEICDLQDLECPVLEDDK